ncbi:Protein of unknown function [Mucilaginibacter lappiensis]|uniref:Uncharacterized membrane protein YbhN (UPF0104 family) n=1 Tax=Mucilaginibacter lappiensis TaxID=354630 RepID=A0ABR6PRW7_9SPHI|nr:DUF4231 domain-containing protein [Mucilaginibacter lappiensis]MBB6112523.1 uncharacterized membrane protein YbhN (UPF0104 family) [Mucilaginibacter lappiensis]SIS02695.1 Protein of unknown function [Mucilaginibacter lappiensis]
MQSETIRYKVISEDLPELYDAANTASLRAQKGHLTIIKGYIVLLVIGSILTMYSEKIDNAPSYAIFLFLGSLCLTILQAYKRFDKIWYNGRAVAESIKTRSWRYMMKAEPYKDQGNNELVNSSFRSELKEILRENSSLGSHLDTGGELRESVTPKMILIRSLDLESRKEIYRNERIDDQRKWYAIKAVKNKRAGNSWFVTLVVVHVMIICFLVVKISHPHILLPADTFIVIAASIVTWTQVKRYHDLSTSYTLTAREIGIIKGDSESVRTEDGFSDFVKDAENAFSREHTQWYARKDT